MAPGALQQRQMISSPGIINQSGRFAQTKSKLSFAFNRNEIRVSPTFGDGVINHQSVQNDSSPGSGGSSPRVITHAEIRNGNYLLNANFDDLHRMRDAMQPRDVENAVQKYKLYVENAANVLVDHKYADAHVPILKKLLGLMCEASALPTCNLRNALTRAFRDHEGMKILIENCVSKDLRLQFSSARLLVECLNPGNQDYVVQHGLIKVMHVVRAYNRKEKSTVDQSKVCTGLLAKLFEHSEVTCMDVISQGGLGVLLVECQSRDTTTLRNCARALANLSLYGGTEGRKLMIYLHAHTWLFTLAFNADDSVKYYALLATAVLAADKSIEAAVIKCDTLDLIDPFVATHLPEDLVAIDGVVGQVLGQEQHWLQRLVPLLSSDRHEAHTLAAFHFCAEAHHSSQSRHGKIDGIFGAIGVVAPLKELAGSLDDVTSGLAAQALKWVGEQVPRPLSQKVPLWKVEDVLQWAKGAGFGECEDFLADDQMEGDWLLTLTEEYLKERIGMHNGIMRKRFMRELHKLKQFADYSCIDSTNLNSFLQSIGSEFSVYTYSMLKAGVNYESIRFLTDGDLANKCGITNGIHRNMILNSIKDKC